MNGKYGRLEVKQNGAGRLYFVLRSTVGRTLLISQSFQSRKCLEDCINSMKDAFEASREKDEVSGYPCYEISKDSRGIYLIIIHQDSERIFLLSGCRLQPNGFLKSIQEVKALVGSFVVVDVNE